MSATDIDPMRWEVALDMAGSYVRSRRFDDARAILETLLYGEPRAATQEALGQTSFLSSDEAA